jgi:hypothetical protein
VNTTTPGDSSCTRRKREEGKEKKEKVTPSIIKRFT